MVELPDDLIEQAAIIRYGIAEYWNSISEDARDRCRNGVRPLVEMVAARVRAEALREAAEKIAPNRARPSGVIIVGARMTEEVLALVRDVEDSLVVAVRAEAEAEERQRVVGEIEQWYRAAFAEFERAVAAEKASDEQGRAVAVANRRRAFTVMDTWAQAWSAARAAGSVPVATPEPTVEIGGVTMTQRQFDAARYPLLHPPVCKHGQTAGHWWPPGPEGYEVCPGPVATQTEPAKRCDGTLGTRPSWMGVDQYDPCRCWLPAGHTGGHQCEHENDGVTPPFAASPVPAKQPEER